MYINYTYRFFFNIAPISISILLYYLEYRLISSQKYIFMTALKFSKVLCLSILPRLVLLDRQNILEDSIVLLAKSVTPKDVCKPFV